MLQTLIDENLNCLDLAEAHLRVAHVTVLLDGPRLQPAIWKTLQTLVLGQAAADEAFPRSWRGEERVSDDSTASQKKKSNHS